MAKYTNDELLEAFGEMTLVELSEFVKAFEEKFDVEAAAPAAVAVAAPGAAAPAEEEKDEFDVILSAVGDKKIQVIKAVRAMRAEMNVHPAKKTSMVIETASPAAFEKGGAYLARFAFATDVTFTEKYEGSTDGMVQVSTHAARGFIPMMELIDRDKELARLNKEKAKAEKEMAMFANQLNNPKFVERAPAALVEDIRNKYAKSQDKLANIEQSIKALG